MFSITYDPARQLITTVVEHQRQTAVQFNEAREDIRIPDADALFAEEFSAFAKQFSGRFRFYLCYSREQATSITESHEIQGHVQDKFPGLALNPATDIVYLCGNPGMIDAAFGMLTEAYGFDKKSVRREKYSFAH